MAGDAARRTVIGVDVAPGGSPSATGCARATVDVRTTTASRPTSAAAPTSGAWLIALDPSAPAPRSGSATAGVRRPSDDLPVGRRRAIDSALPAGAAAPRRGLPILDSRTYALPARSRSPRRSRLAIEAADGQRPSADRTDAAGVRRSTPTADPDPEQRGGSDALGRRRRGLVRVTGDLGRCGSSTRRSSPAARSPRTARPAATRASSSTAARRDRSTTASARARLGDQRPDRHPRRPPASGSSTRSSTASAARAPAAAPAAPATARR